MKYIFHKKIAERQIGEFINQFYLSYIKNPKDRFHFDLSRVEWISSQGMTLFFSLLAYLIEKDIAENRQSFQITFIHKGISTIDIPKRVALQIINIWDNWSILALFEGVNFYDYIGIDVDIINSLKEENKINDFKRKYIYREYDIINPIIALNYIDNPDYALVVSKLNEYHELNEATFKIAVANNCEHPFVNGLFGELLTREIYSNFLDHHEVSFLNPIKKYGFFCLSVKGKINDEFYSEEKVQSFLRLNFNTEELSHSRTFFYDNKQKKYLNRPYLSYTYIDYGIGIATSLRKEYIKQNPSISDPKDSDVIRYAFQHQSSRFPIDNTYGDSKLKDYIPRGLFDVISLVIRYKGVLIIRSGHGKVIYNFSTGEKIKNTGKDFGDENLFFPGTYVTFYLAPIKSDEYFDESVIKPQIEIPKTLISKVPKYLSLKEIFYKIKGHTKPERNRIFLNQLVKYFESNKNSLTYLSFKDISNEDLVKKTIFFLISDYNINLLTNVVVLHPPNLEVLKILEIEILKLSEVNLKYKIHPLPFVYYDKKEKDLEVFWLGINNKKDEKTLNNLLYDEFSLAKSEFAEPDGIIGHLNHFDENGNLKSFFPKADDLAKAYLITELYSKIFDIRLKITNTCIEKKDDKLFLCSGNYYQYEFIQIIRLLNDESQLKEISTLLFDLIFNRIESADLKNRNWKFISVTTSSERIIDSLISQNIISSKDTIRIDNYHNIYDLKYKLPLNKADFDYILICDVVATGNLVKKIEEVLGLNGLSFIGVVADTLDLDFRDSKEFHDQYQNRLISILKHPIKKFERNSDLIQKDLNNKGILRINPYTNIPVELSIKKTNSNQIILDEKEFLDVLDNQHINIGFLRFNNLIHPYFFDTELLLKEKGSILLEKIFSATYPNQTPKLKIETKDLRIFYPKKSDIRNLDFNYIKNSIFRDHSIKEFKLDRYNVEDGWKFPHTTDYFKNIVQNKPVLILDDGTCTGDSLIQMVNEISFFEPKVITVLCLIGRLPEHKREFLSSIRTLEKSDKESEIQVFFGTQWYLPTYYVNNNPTILEYNRLLEVYSKHNTPSIIKKYARTISYSLSLKTKEEFTNYRYLPKYRGKRTNPKKEIIGVRNEIGKVVGYRFYLNSFDWFNDLIKQIENQNTYSKKTIKSLELISACLSFEPYLFEKLRKILPDITKILQNFINFLIFGDSENDYKRIELDELTYKWDYRDFLHLFFIYYPENESINKLSQDGNVKRLLEFMIQKEIAPGYFFYKILNLFPINPEELDFKNPVKVKSLLRLIPDLENAFPLFFKQLKIFSAFIYTIPTRKNYSEQLLSLSQFFIKVKKGEKHKDSIRATVGLLVSDIHSAKSNFDSLDKEKFNKDWKRILVFLGKIFGFVNTYPTYCPSGTFDQVVDTMKIYKSLIEQISDLRIDSNFNSIRKGLESIRENVFLNESEIFQLFEEPFIQDLELTIKKTLSTLNPKINYEIDNRLKIKVKAAFPEFYFKEVILEYLMSNFEHADLHKGPVMFVIDESTNKSNVHLIIENHIKYPVNPGSGYGAIRIDRVKDFPKGYFKFPDPIDNGETYKQEIILKKELDEF